MSVSLYMDVHVPQGISRALERRGVDVLTAQADGTDRLPDDALLDRALVLNRVLFTRDEDFLTEASMRQQKAMQFGGIVYAHQLLVTIGQCVNDLEFIAKCAHWEELANRVTHLPLR